MSYIVILMSFQTFFSINYDKSKLWSFVILTMPVTAANR